MLKIAEIESTPNPNAMKFILKEPLTWGITRSYDNAEQANSCAYNGKTLINHYQSGLLRFSLNPENMTLKLMLILSSSPALASTECCR